MAGEIQLNGTTALTESGGEVTLNNVDSATNRTNLGLGYASTSEVQGTHTTGTITSGTTSLTVASGSGISNGDYVVGEGIAPGTTVSSGGGTTSITLSANAAATLSSDPVSFYTANKALSPGLVAGQLCRAWVNFNGTGTVAIRAAHNVSSITDNGTNAGDYTVNFATAMPDANYCAIATSNRHDGIYATIHLKTTTPLSTTSVRFQNSDNDSNTVQNALFVCVAVFR